MAKYLKFDLDQYGTDGTIPLFRQDDWTLTGRIFEQNGANKEEVSISGYTGVSAFFPGCPCGSVVGSITVVDALVAKVQITLPKTQTSGTMLSDTGSSMYITMTDENSLLTTIPTVDAPLQIQDRGFGNV